MEPEKVSEDVRPENLSVRRALTALATLGVVVFAVLTIAIVATGDFAFELGGMRFKSNSLDPLLKGLASFAAIRLALATSVANAALMAFGVVAGLGLIELMLRIVPVPLADPSLVEIHRPSTRYGYELVPGAKGFGTVGEWIEIGPGGYRDHGTLPLGVGPRIVVLGDSFTFGMGVDVENGYVAQLEVLLRQWCGDVRVVNLGVIAYDFWHYLELLDDRVPELEPDLVVIGMFIDDILHPEKPAKVHPKRVFEDAEVDEYSRWRLINVYRNLVVWLEARYRSQRGAEYLRSIEERREWIGPDEPVHDYYRVQTGSLGEDIYAGFTRSVERLSGWSKTHHTPVLLVLIPDSTQLGLPERQVVNRQVEQEFARVSIPYVDLTPRFEDVPDPRTLFLFPIDAHTNAAGHALIAEAIATNPLVLDITNSSCPEHEKPFL